MITTRVNAINNNELDLQDNYNIFLILYDRHIDSKIKDIDIIMLAPEIIHNIKYYR